VNALWGTVGNVAQALGLPRWHSASAGELRSPKPAGSRLRALWPALRSVFIIFGSPQGHEDRLAARVPSGSGLVGRRSRLVRLAGWLSALALAAGSSGGGAARFRVLSYMNRYDQPVGIIEASTGVFYSNAGAIHPVVFSFDAGGTKTILAAFAPGEHVLGQRAQVADLRAR